ncbi:MAG: hypothetical protein H7Y38_16465 [Armatimonadetes bacterium]|nr:hypothetical protein [Armatimonadota bacterium]
MQFANGEWKPVGFQHVGSLIPAPEWQFREDIINVPEGAVQLGVLLYVDGKGKAWLDDIAVTREP